MNTSEKRIIFSDLVKLREKLIGSANRKDESIFEYSERIWAYNKEYMNLGKLAQQHFREVLEEEREKLAIFV